MTKWTTTIFLTAILGTRVVQGQMGGNTCFFKIFIDYNKIYMPSDTVSFTLFNNDRNFKQLKFKGTDNCPDSCWSLCSGDVCPPDSVINHPDEYVIFKPLLIIIKKYTNDTMRIHFKYVVHSIQTIYHKNQVERIPIVNEILFISGNFEVYERVSKKDWISLANSQKIKQIAEQPRTRVLVPINKDK